MLEELCWWSGFLCRQPVYSNWLHLIKITAETATFGYMVKKGCFIFSIGCFSYVAINI